MSPTPALKVVDRTGVPLDLMDTERIAPVTHDGLNRYEAALNIDVKEKLEPRALPAFFDMHPGETMSALMNSPAGAPILQATPAQRGS